MLVEGTTWTTRLPANAALYGLAPARAGKRGRPALKGAKLGKPAVLAADAAWRRVSVHRYGRTESVDQAVVACIWYGSFGNTPGRCVLVREANSTKAYDLALFTFDAEATPESYRAARERARALIAHLSAEGQARVLGGTAARLFGFE